MASAEFTIDLDTTDIDKGLEKAERLKALLLEIKVLQREIGGTEVKRSTRQRG